MLEKWRVRWRRGDALSTEPVNALIARKQAEIARETAQYEPSRLQDAATRAAELADSGRLGEALALLEDALRLGPNPQLTLMRAVVLERAGRESEACSAYSQATFRLPQDADAWMGKARCLINLNGLIGAAPSDTTAYAPAIEATERAAALGDEQAAAILDVLSSFATIHQG